MRHFHDPQHPRSNSLLRGVTLTEVLMSLMIMSIGVSAVIVLFPISVLRSVQATQLTNAAILKRNIESELRQNPKLIFDPDGDYDLVANDVQRQQALSEHFQGAAARNYIVDPAGFYAFYGQDNDGSGTIDAADDLFAASFGNSGTVPGFSVGTPLTARFLGRFDGRVMSSLLGTTSAASVALSADQLKALSELALKRARLGDGRTVQLDTFVAAPLTRTLGGNSYLVGVELVDTVSEDDLSQIPTSANSNPGNLIADPENSEIVIFSENGNFSQTFPLTHIDPSRRAVFWSEYDDDTGGSAWTDFNQNNLEDVRPLPREFRGTAGRVVLRSSRTADFTWLLTVRRSSDGNVSSGDIVIRHNVGITLEDEFVFPAVFTSGLSTVGVNNVGTVEPNIKRGQFVLDPVNARWYRIASVSQPSASAAPTRWSGFDYQVELETAAVAGSGSLADPSDPMSVTIPGAIIFVPHIVDVYPLSSLSLPESL